MRCAHAHSYDLYCAQGLLQGSSLKRRGKSVKEELNVRPNATHLEKTVSVVFETLGLRFMRGRYHLLLPGAGDTPASRAFHRTIIFRSKWCGYNFRSHFLTEEVYIFCVSDEELICWWYRQVLTLHMVQVAFMREWIGHAISDTVIFLVHLH